MLSSDDNHASILARLVEIIEQRNRERPVDSYVARLLDQGHALISAKVIEEAYELIEACGDDDSSNRVHEAADLMFHLLVLLSHAEVAWPDVERELARRFGVSGLFEKRQRPKDAKSPEDLP